MVKSGSVQYFGRDAQATAKDNPEAAAKSADLALKLCQQIEEQDDISDDLSEIIEAFEKEHNVSLSHNTHML